MDYLRRGLKLGDCRLVLVVTPVSMPIGGLSFGGLFQHPILHCV